MPMLSVAQVAERLGLSTNAVRDAIARGDIPASRLGGRVLRVRPEDLDRWIDASRVRRPSTPSSEPADERATDQ